MGGIGVGLRFYRCINALALTSFPRRRGSRGFSYVYGTCVPLDSRLRGNGGVVAGMTGFSWERRVDRSRSIAARSASPLRIDSWNKNAAQVRRLLRVVRTSG